MPHTDPQRQLSLVPYTSDSREVVLRHGSSVVVIDPLSKELSLRKTSQAFVGSTDCPLCHRPLQESTKRYEDDEDDTVSSHEEQTFVNPDYFRMLAHSIPPSPSSSRPPSPLKRLPASLTEGAQIGREQTPPHDAEFIGSTAAPRPKEQGIRGSSFVPNYFKSFFVEKRELGRGGRGVVLLVEHVLDRVSLGEFACKRIPVGNDHGWLEKVLVEVQLLQRLNHPNLVSYRHVWLEDAQITNFGPSVPCIFILQQYCNAGDLHNYVLKSAKVPVEPEDLKARMRRKSRGHPDVSPSLQAPRMMQFEEIFSFFRDITSGLHHLHTNGYIHRDLKPSNCLLYKAGGRLTVHVSDFGEVQATSAKRSSTGATGTISYCAPEVLRRETPDGEFGNFSTKSDIFSLGMIVYFMCFGHLPYANADEVNDENEDIDKLRAEVSRWNGFDESIRARTDLPERLYSFLKQLLSPNPADRPSTGQILKAIKAGGDIDVSTNSPPKLSESGPRITSVDTPTHQMVPRSRTRRPSAGLSGPGLSPVRRHRSSGESLQAPDQDIRETARQHSITNHPSAIAPAEKMEAPPWDHQHTDDGSQPHRLIMAPPSTLGDRVLGVSQRPVGVMAFKGVLFFFKLLTLSRPCAPYAANSTIFYSLMCLSVVDFLLQVGLLGSSMLLGLHLVVWLIAMRTERLCSHDLLI